MENSVTLPQNLNHWFFNLQIIPTTLSKFQLSDHVTKNANDYIVMLFLWLWFDFQLQRIENIFKMYKMKIVSFLKNNEIQNAQPSKHYKDDNYY